MIVTDSRTVVMFGEGDVSISVDDAKHPDSKPCVGINIGRIEEGKYNVGEIIRPNEEVENIVYLLFDNVGSLESMKRVVDKAIEELSRKISENSKDNYMRVNLSDIIVPDSLKKRVPDEEEFDNVARSLGDKDNHTTTIVIDEDMNLVDGYAEYLLLKALVNAPGYGNVVDVIANDGIEIGVCYCGEIKNDELTMRVYSNKVCAKYTEDGTLVLTNLQKDGSYDMLKFKTCNPIDTICSIGDSVHDLDIIIDTSCGDISDEEYKELSKHFANVLKC